MKKDIRNRLRPAERLRFALKRYKGITIETDLEPYIRRVEDIRSCTVGSMSDLDIAAEVDTMRRERKPDLNRMYALTAEAVKRVLGLGVFDVQLIAALVLNRRKLAQVRTGEGKTLSAVFPAAFSALDGRGVHVLTANDYLAGRDAEWMGDVYWLLGLGVGTVREGMSPAEKKEAYRRDITYLTAKQAGFDFLNDGLRYCPEDRCMRALNFCIVDEADFIMIDEARNPMVIAGERDDREIDPVGIDRFARSLREKLDFTVDRFGRNCFLTLLGQRLVEDHLGCGGMHEEESLPLYAAVNVALHAHHLLARDVDYLVRRDGIELIDESTGRTAENRRWPYGIHTAIEVKEGLPPHREGLVYGSITVQHFLGLYAGIAAMTATAVSAAEEFKLFYGLDTVIIPPNSPERMEHHPDLVFCTARAKMNALLEEIQRVHRTGRPVLVGTKSVRESQELSDLLAARRVPHEVLNAKNDQKEAALVARAGMYGAVTISTNMAGRGTDIRLGGPEGSDRARVAALGGLYVIGTGRYESVRVDNQLRGRAGRQGDPGESRFFVSLEDDLVTRYAITDFIPEKYIGNPSPDPVSDPAVAKEIARAQEIIEEQHFQMRTTLRRYTELVERQRKIMAALREDAVDRRTFPGEATGLDAEKGAGIFLKHLDAFWVNHLAWIEHLREGIHLRRLGQEDPLLSFISEASEAFDRGLEGVYRDTAAELDSVPEDKADPGPPDIRGPASTWTYMVNDNPFPNFRVSLFGSGGSFDMAEAIRGVLLVPVLLVLRLLRKK